MARHTLAIEGWHPARLNHWQGRHWSVAHRKKKADRGVVSLEAMRHKLPKAQTPRRVSLHLVYRKGQRRCDKDAYWKSLLDALVCAGLLVNDSPAWCDLGPVTDERSGTDRHATVVTLEDGLVD